MVKNIKAEIIQPVVFKGLPDEDDIEKIEELAYAIAEKHRELFEEE